MKDIRFLRLNDRWALATDGLQWVVQRKQGTKWRAVAFIGSTKAVLERVLREEGGAPTLDAKRALDALPDDFRTWWDENRHRFPALKRSTRDPN